MLKTDPKFKEYTCQIIFKEVGARTGFNLDNLMEEIGNLKITINMKITTVFLL